MASVAATSGCAYKHFAPIPYRPALYEATRPDLPGRITLFGSIHAGIARFYPLPDAVLAAYAQADRLAIEIDIDAHLPELRAAVAPLAGYAPGQSIADVVSPQVVRALRAHQGHDEREWHRAQRLRPWALALGLVSADDAGLEASRAQGVEAHLLAAARRDGKPVTELETATEQALAFAGGAPAEQEAMLALRLRQIEAFDRTFGAIVDAWRVGDVERLDALKAHAWPQGGALGEARRRVFDERDARMAQRLVQLAAHPQRVLAVLGAFHLVGERSVLAGLREAGFAVRRIDYDR